MGSAPSDDSRARKPALVTIGVMLTGAVLASEAIFVISHFHLRAPAMTPGTPHNVMATAEVCEPPACPDIDSSIATVTWTPAPGPAPNVGYEIRRDGIFVGRTGPRGTAYIDRGLATGEPADYRVRALGPDAASKWSDPAHVNATEPSLRFATLDGTFRVKSRVLAVHNMTNFIVHDPKPGDTHVFDNWNFETVECGEPPCDSIWSNATPALKHTGNVFRGTVVDRDTCQLQLASGRVKTTRLLRTYTLRIRITGARYLYGRYLVTSFVGVDSDGLFCRGAAPGVGTALDAGKLITSSA